MLRKIIGEKFYCGLDIGSQRLKAALMKAADPHCQELLGVYEAKTLGFKDSSVSDLVELTECIHKTLTELSKKTGVKLKEIHLGVGGDFIEVRKNNSVMPLVDRGSKVIGSHDVKKINNQARLLGLKVEEEILHDFPQYYKVDDVNTALNPVGLLGRKLEVYSLLIVANLTRLRNITKAVNQAGYEVANVFFSGFSAASVSLNEQLKSDGCVLIDIGSKVTNILIFKNGLLRHLDRIPMGGDHLTLRIMLDLNLPFNLAEDIKKSYANAISTDEQNEEEILVKKNSAYLPIKRKEIVQSIKPEIDKFVEAIKNSLNSSGMLEEIKGGMVVIGGGALLTGMIERIEQETSLSVSIGKARVGLKSLTNAVTFAAAVGLSQMGLNHSFGVSPLSDVRTTWTKGLVGRIKEFYQEYF
ncbi:MAG: cell division protein FtsA [Candidatus Omnitrophota bacterium]